MSKRTNTKSCNNYKYVYYYYFFFLSSFPFCCTFVRRKKKKKRIERDTVPRIVRNNNNNSNRGSGIKTHACTRTKRKRFELRKYNNKPSPAGTYVRTCYHYPGTGRRYSLVFVRILIYGTVEDYPLSYRNTDT